MPMISNYTFSFRGLEVQNISGDKKQKVRNSGVLQHSNFENSQTFFFSLSKFPFFLAMGRKIYSIQSARGEEGKSK